MTSIYRKPTFTDTIIPYSSNHPAQHKYAAIRFLYNRLNTYNLHKEEYKGETNTIQDIMLNNGFPVHTHQLPTHKPPHHHFRWTHWHHHTQMGLLHILWQRNHIYYKPIQKTDLRISLCTNNTIQKLLMPKLQTTDKYSRSRSYKLTCQDCNKAYVGQTGRSFVERFKEHRQAFTSNSHISNYAKHHRTVTLLRPRSEHDAAPTLS